MSPLRTLLPSRFQAIEREIGLQADLEIGAASVHSLGVLLDIQQVIAVCLCALPDIQPARIGKKRANPPDEIVKNHFFMAKSPLNQRTGCPAKLWRHGWCIGLLTLASHHAQNPTKAGLPRAVRVAAGVDRSAALNELKSICFSGLLPYSRQASPSIASKRPVLRKAWAPEASSNSCLPSPPFFA